MTPLAGEALTPEVDALEWEPSTHHAVPQPAGQLCADWYTARKPNDEDLLYALAHVKGEADTLRAVLAGLVKVIEEWPSIHEGGDYLHGGALMLARAALATKEPRNG